MPALDFDHKQPNRGGEAEPGSMQKQSDFRRSRGEKGQTIILVAVSLVSLLAMAALAIDVVTLYVARSEIQRAADAAALAGAKAIADSGVTTLPSTDPNFTAAATLAQSMANSAVSAAVLVNLVAGSAPTLATGSPSFPSFSTTTQVNSWQVTVTLQQANLPTFFARIFGQRGASTQASATAEAYNPGNIIPSMGSFTPIAPRCVKPWLVANADPDQSGHNFVAPPSSVNSGAVEFSVTGEEFWLTADCVPGSSSTCTLINPTPAAIPANNEVQYVPSQVSTTTSSYVCPSSCVATSDYAQSMQCCDTNTYACGGPATATNAAWDNATNPNQTTNTDTPDAIECLIHAAGTGSGQGQDSIDSSLWPLSGPMEIHAKSGSTLVTTSNSVVTIPIIDTSVSFPATGGNVHVIGFLQAFIEQFDASNNIQVKVLNAVGCSNDPGGAPVIGGNGASVVPVRLISP